MVIAFSLVVNARSNKNELPYQTNDTPTVLPIWTIEQLQDLVDTSIFEVVDNNHIQALVDDIDKKMIIKMTITKKKIQTLITMTPNLNNFLYIKL